MKREEQVPHWTMADERNLRRRVQRCTLASTEMVLARYEDRSSSSALEGQVDSHRQDAAWPAADRTNIEWPAKPFEP